MIHYLKSQILVIFCGPDVVKVNAIRSVATQIVNKDSLSRLILVLQNHITSQALKAVDLFSFKVEMFQVSSDVFFVKFDFHAVIFFIGLFDVRFVNFPFDGDFLVLHDIQCC